MPPKTFAMKLKTLRISRGLTQVELAKKLGMKQPSLARLENGAVTNPTLDTVRRLARVLKCTVVELVE